MKKTFDVDGCKVTIEIPNCYCQQTARPQWTAPTTCAAPRVEDGFDAHIDRPQRSNYRGEWYSAERAYTRDLAKYNKALEAVKACDWECREPIGCGMPMPQRPTPQPRQWNCKCNTAQPQRELRQKWGVAPIGAKVVDYTPSGEYIFDK